MTSSPQLPPQGMDPEAYRLQLGKTKEEMIAMFGEPKAPQPPQNFMQAGFQQYYHPTVSTTTLTSSSTTAAPPPPPVRPPKGARPLPPPVGAGSELASNAPAPMHDRRQVHHDDKQWMKDYQRQHPELSRKEVKNAFIATFGRVPA